MKRLAAIAAFKLSYFLKNRVDESVFRRYARLISSDVTREEVEALSEDAAELFEDRPDLAECWERLCRLCEDDPVALSAVELSLMARMDE